MKLTSSRWKWILGAAIGFLTAGILWWSTTPSFGLVQIYWAVSFQNEKLFRSRLDVNKVALGFASDFVDSQIPQMGLGGEGGNVLSQILIPFREQFEMKTAEAVEEFVSDYFAKDSHGYMSLIRGLPFVAVKGIWSKDPEFHFTEWPILHTDSHLSVLKLRLMWWEESKEVIAKMENQSGRWVVTRIIVSTTN
jgi:hypothetical protein